MAKPWNTARLSRDARNRGRKKSDQGNSSVLPEPQGCREYQWAPVLAPDEARAAGLTDYDREVLQDVAESLATSGLSEDRAAAAFAHVMGWAVGKSPDQPAAVVEEVRRAS
jgi:hypothetical protein